ncbi:hypothetical protein [Gemmatimonas sp.]|uniref:hypothetical protein n=2 Tax=Gemmatimonas sp. TaxID=1962908 RepID=UPI0035621668
MSSRLHPGTGLLGIPDSWDLPTLLTDQPKLRVVPNAEAALVVSGAVRCWLCGPQGVEINEEFVVELRVPSRFPAILPAVFEQGGCIPPTFHHLDDGALCLGSPMMQRVAIEDAPTLPAFMTRVVLPYLYGFAYHARTGTMPFGELAHGSAGLEEDARRFFRVGEKANVVRLLLRAGERRRVANKRACPCGSPRRLGACHHTVVNAARARFGRDWFRRQAELLIRQRLLERPAGSGQ